MSWQNVQITEFSLVAAQTQALSALGAKASGATICFLEQAYSHIFSTSQQDINTNVLRSADVGVRCVS